MKIRQVGANMTEVHIPGATILFSYETPVAAQVFEKTGVRYYRTEKRGSTTTSKHIGKWLDGCKFTEKPQEFFEHLVQVKPMDGLIPAYV
ncbi:hypothetical protein [Anaeroselena agilis]|uniref:DUF8033 domain-containing protein n=1 Tax=Anaeroselena agilis TaxID=3063788 RepID=A0ABU3NUX6_9FIRM|nr:hypothetical protein [Selenomonadales bacterium 4137-cl]